MDGNSRERLAHKLATAETLIEIQQKLPGCWGTPWRAPTDRAALPDGSRDDPGAHRRFAASFRDRAACRREA